LRLSTRSPEADLHPEVRDVADLLVDHRFRQAEARDWLRIMPPVLASPSKM
jgi:hypothetical protein